MTGIFLAGGIGIAMQSISVLEFGKIVQNGFMSMTEIMFLTFFISGLSALAAEGGGITWILNKLSTHFSSKRSAEFGIAALVSLGVICTANNTIAIIVTGKMARKISQHFGIKPSRTASLLDLFASSIKGILPYGTQLLLIGSLAKISPFSVITYSWYPILLGISGLIAITDKSSRGHKKCKVKTNYCLYYLYLFFCCFIFLSALIFILKAAVMHFINFQPLVVC